MSVRYLAFLATYNKRNGSHSRQKNTHTLPTLDTNIYSVESGYSLSFVNTVLKTRYESHNKCDNEKSTYTILFCDNNVILKSTLFKHNANYKK